MACNCSARRWRLAASATRRRRNPAQPPNRRPHRYGDRVRVAVPRETAEGERRVAVVPDTVARLVADGCDVLIEGGAGNAAFVTDDDLRSRGAVIANRDEMLRTADIVLSVQPLRPDD